LVTVTISSRLLYVFLVNVKKIIYFYFRKISLLILNKNLSGSNSGGGFSYYLSFELRFSNSFSSRSTLLSQVQSGVDYYASQSSLIQSSIATNFPTYTLIKIEATDIKNSILITSFSVEARTFKASLYNVLIMQSSSSASQIDPNVYFSNLTTLVNLKFYKLNARLILSWFLENF
jgi:hypothetical protein